MAIKDAQTFVFVGDTAVGAPLVSSLLQAGFEGADSLETADVVFTYHESQTSLEDIYYEEPGLLTVSKEGAILVDLSPSTPAFAQEIYAIATVNNRFFIDAPLYVRDVTMQSAFALPSNLVCFVGAEPQVYDVVSPLLRAMAGRVSWMGNTGAGQVAKTAATVQTAAALVGIVESYNSFALSGGLSDFEEYLDLMESSGAISPLQVNFIEAILNKGFEGTYTVEIVMGELLAAFATSEESQTPLLQADSAFHMFELLAIVGGAALNPAALSLVFADEEAAKEYKLDWSRAEGTYDHDHHHSHDCDCEDRDDLNHECACRNHDEDDYDYDDDYDEFDWE